MNHDLLVLFSPEFAADYPLAGGAFNYISLTFGEFAAWVAACDLILEYTLSAVSTFYLTSIMACLFPSLSALQAAVAKGFTAYLASLIGIDLGRLRLQSGVFTLGGRSCDEAQVCLRLIIAFLMSFAY